MISYLVISPAIMRRLRQSAKAPVNQTRDQQNVEETVNDEPKQQNVVSWSFLCLDFGQCQRQTLL